jgi:putative inorganic carbon (HCO3(-)) transporter
MLLVAPALWFPSVRPELTVLALGLYVLLPIAGVALGLSLWPRSESDVALVVLIGAAVVGAIRSNSPELTLPKVTALLLGVGWYYALLQLPDESAPRVALLVTTALACLLVIVGLMNGLAAAKVPVLAQVRAQVPRLLVQLPDAQDGRASMNQLGGALLLVIPVLLALLMGSREGLGWPTGTAWALVLISFLLFSGTLVITQSRGAWGGMIAGAALVVALSGKWGRWLVGLGIVMLLLGWVLWGRQHLSADVIQMLTAREGVVTAVGDLSVAGRLEIGRTVLAGIVDNPWTGCGWGTLRATTATHAHNVLLQVAYDMGIPGLVAYLAMVIVAVRQCLGALSGPWGVRRSLAIGGLGALVAYHVYGMVDVVALGAKPGVLWWCLMALIAVAGKGRRWHQRAGEAPASGLCQSRYFPCDSPQNGNFWVAWWERTAFQVGTLIIGWGAS